MRQSGDVAEYGAGLLEKGAGALPADELWLVHEQVALAALDMGNLGLAERCVRKLDRKFEGSARVMRLKGSVLEAKGEWGKADALYQEILKENEADQGAWKRRVAVCKGKGDLAGAAKLLKQYLKVFMADAEAWEEAADVYVGLGLFKQAAFCLEEVILANPQNPHTHLRYADVLYTLGQPGNLRTAMQHYATALELTDGQSARALYGATCVYSHLCGLKGPLKATAEEAKLPKLCAEVLNKKYTKEAPAKLPFVQDALVQMGFSQNDLIG